MYYGSACIVLLISLMDQHICQKELSTEAQKNKIESIRKDCDKTFTAIKNNPSFATMQEIYKDLPESVTNQNVMKLYDRFIQICNKYGSNESAPDDTHKQAVLDSIPKSR